MNHQYGFMTEEILAVVPDFCWVTTDDIENMLVCKKVKIDPEHMKQYICKLVKRGKLKSKRNFYKHGMLYIKVRK